jgi:hypothetical protein
MTFKTTFAGPDHEISSQLRTAFQKDFNKAELVDYASGKDYNRLTLKMNDMIVFAYYSENGDTRITLKSYNNDSWETLKRKAKD